MSKSAEYMFLAAQNEISKLNFHFIKLKSQKNEPDITFLQKIFKNPVKTPYVKLKSFYKI